MRKKYKSHAKTHEEKKEEKRKIAHTFKGNHQKERESCSKEYKKYLEIGRFKIPYTCTS